jgi:hypothetical protein
VKPDIRYTVEEADIQADGKHVRLIARFEGRYSHWRDEKPRQIERLRLEQAVQLRDDLNELIRSISTATDQNGGED